MNTAGATQTSWQPSIQDLQRFVELQERRGSGQQVSAQDQAFIGQVAAYAVDAVEIQHGTFKAAFIKSIQNGQLSTEEAGDVGFAAVLVPDLPHNRELQTLLQSVLNQGTMTDGQLEKIIEHTKKLSDAENAALQPALAALELVGGLSDKQVERLREWLSGALAVKKEHRQKQEFVGEIGKLGIMAATIGIIVGAQAMLGSLPIDLSQVAEIVARIGITLGAVFGIARPAMKQLANWVAQRVHNFGVHD
jgi:hypothetical protein